MNKCEVIYIRKNSIKSIFFCVIKRVTVSYRSVIFIYSLLVQSVWKKWESIPRYKQNMKYWNELLKIKSFLWSIVWGMSWANQHPCHNLDFILWFEKKMREKSHLCTHRLYASRRPQNRSTEMLWQNQYDQSNLN